MNVGILGTGDVGRAGRGFIALGHAVKVGARDARRRWFFRPREPTSA
jgi:predicted dinucleotide-binding enzyme